MMGHFGGWAAGGGVFAFLFWLLIALVFVFLVKELAGVGNSSDERHKDGSDEKALQILDERFAKGEIDEEEYRRRKEEINS